MKVRFSSRALKQIDDIADYVAAQSPRVADAIVRRIETMAALIGNHPGIGRPTSKARVRVFSVLPYPYLLFYEADEVRGEIVVLLVRHAARREDWRKGR
jgi:plasmid stabilization system protein ParE